MGLKSFRKENGIEGRSSETVGRLFISLLCAIYSCPFHFYEKIGSGVDGSWMWALNKAVQEGKVFGRDFVFTYGPLGFLHSRNREFVGSELLFAGDLLLSAGFFYLVYKYLSKNKWWWLVLFAATIAARGANYSQTMFMLFMAFTIISIGRKDIDRATLVFCAMYGVLLFFVKINYGFITLTLILLTTLLMAFRRQKGSYILFGSATLFFIVLYANVHVDIADYIRYGIPVISNYDEAMFHAIDLDALPYQSAIYFLLVTGIFLFVYLFQLIKKRKLTFSHFFVPTLAVVTVFLFYKNAFTRYDGMHFEQFFTIYPLFFIALVFTTEYSDRLLPGLVALSLIGLSYWNLAVTDEQLRNLQITDWTYRLSVKGYYCGIFEKFSEAYDPGLLLPRVKSTIGNSPIDIFPDEITIAKVNGFNYSPRPIPQSYSVYGRSLDSLNASHFAKNSRPEFVLIRNSGFDGRYPVWEESLTKATIHLNYMYESAASGSDTLLKDDRETYLLYRSKRAKGILPKFEKVGNQTVGLDDTIIVKQDDIYPIYMSADIRYTAVGIINKLLLQPMMFRMTLFTSDSGVYEYRLILPIAHEPVLISHYIGTNQELQNFLSGNIRLNKNIEAFIISTHNTEVKKDIGISFYRFKNY